MFPLLLVGSFLEWKIVTHPQIFLCKYRLFALVFGASILLYIALDYLILVIKSLNFEFAEQMS